MAEVIDRRYALIQKYMRLRDQYGHDHAIRQFSNQESDDMFSYLMGCATPTNHVAAEAAGAETGSFTITKSL